MSNFPFFLFPPSYPLLPKLPTHHFRAHHQTHHHLPQIFRFFIHYASHALLHTIFLSLTSAVAASCACFLPRESPPHQNAAQVKMDRFVRHPRSVCSAPGDPSITQVSLSPKNRHQPMLTPPAPPNSRRCLRLRSKQVVPAIVFENVQISHHPSGKCLGGGGGNYRSGVLPTQTNGNKSNSGQRKM